ncbi:MAG: aminotransferase class IV [Planctomycetota bacterium]|nr:aminotransferase class IV [Planctomycetota bacterium]
MNDTLFSLNGRIVPEREAVVPVTDRGFLYGDGLFETLHAYGRTPFLLDAHLDRLARGLDALAISGAPSRRKLARWVREAVAAAGFREANVRLTLTRGGGARGPSVRGPSTPFTVVTVTRYKRRPARDYTRGVRAILSRVRRQESGALAGFKTLAYLEQVFARREADAAGADEALLLNSAGLLCEGSASNLTLVRGGALRVPDPRLTGALPGTVQEFVVAQARRMGLPVAEAALGPWDLRDCDEAFLTGSMREVTPLVQVDDARIGNGKRGPVTQRLLEAYRKAVIRDV